MSRSPRYYLEKLANLKTHDYPLATVAFYGPTDERASKVVVGISRAEPQGEESGPDVIEKYFTDDSDARFDPVILDKILNCLQVHSVHRVAMLDRIFGCPHEEGIDYPDGKSCPQCPYWAGRDRYTQERIH